MGFSPLYNDNCEQILQQKDLKNLHITRGGGGGRVKKIRAKENLSAKQQGATKNKPSIFF